MRRFTLALPNLGQKLRRSISPGSTSTTGNDSGDQGSASLSPTQKTIDYYIPEEGIFHAFVSPALPSQDREAFTNTLHTCLMNDPPVRFGPAGEYNWAQHDTFKAAMEAGARGKTSACHLSNVCETAPSDKSGPQSGLPESPWANETSASHSQAEVSRIKPTDNLGGEAKSLDEDTGGLTWPQETTTVWGGDSEDNVLDGEEDSRADLATITKPPRSYCAPVEDNPW